jgi:N-acetylmuramoyl-L-alanine amidase
MKVWKKQKGLLVRTMICAVSLAAACFYGNSLPAQAAPRAQETGERVVIVIDPGHGGDNEGTLEGPAQEKKMTMVTALAMYEELTKYDNVDVYLTHTDDVTMSLADRAQFAADRNADFLFSIHYNASMDHDLFGSEVWISSVQPYNAYGYQFGWEQMQQMQDMGLFLRGVKTKLKDNGDDYYGIIRESTSRSIPSAIIEHCHVDERHSLLPDRRGLEEIRQGGCFVCCKIFRIIQCKSWCGLQWRGRRSSGSLAAIHSDCHCAGQDRTGYLPADFAECRL